MEGVPGVPGVQGVPEGVPGGAAGPDSDDFLVRTPSKRSNALDHDLEAIQLDLAKLEERGTTALRRSEDAASEHARGFAQSRSSLTSTGGVIDRILIELQHSHTAIEKRLDAIHIDDEPQHRAKKFQRKMLNGKLSALIDRLEGGKSKLQELLAAPQPAAALQLAPVPRVAARSSAWSSATVNAVLQQTSMGARRGSTSATSTPSLAWRDDDDAGGGAAAVDAPRSPDQRRLEGLFAIDPLDFAPEFNFDFSTLRKDDEEAYTRGGQPYYRPCGWKRFALNVKDSFGLEQCTVKELKDLLRKWGRQQPNT